jgi:hypothetical protein
MKAREFDKAFDDGDAMDAALDWSKSRRPNVEARRVNIDFPEWVVSALDREAEMLGVTRQALVKVWIVEKLEKRREAISPDRP